MNNGKILWFDPQRGIGFLEDAENGAEIFFNAQGIAAGQPKSLEAGTAVSFERAEEPELGKPIAVMVSEKRQ